MLPQDTSRLPKRPNLDKLKRLARALQRAANEGAEPEAARVRAYFALDTGARLKLSQAQTVIAREHGFPAWAALAAEVDARAAQPKKRKPAPIVYPAPDVLAESWFTLADGRDFYALTRVMQVPKRVTLAARALMQAQPVRMNAFIEAVIEGLGHEDSRIRFNLAHTLDTFGDARAPAALAPLMEDRAPRVRWMAMHALTCHDCNEASCATDPAILERIAHHARADENMRVRRHAAVSLGFSRTPYAAGVLRELLQAEAEPKFQMMARWALRYCETGKR